VREEGLKALLKRALSKRQDERFQVFKKGGKDN